MAYIRLPIIQSDHALIPLTQGYFAVIDLEDVPHVCSRQWHVCLCAGGPYARGYSSRRPIYMHQWVMMDRATRFDHRDGDGLNNRRSNLRPANNSQNLGNIGLSSSNTSGFKGVTRRCGKPGWVANITMNCNLVFLGYFDDPVCAARAYDKAALEHFGEFALTNAALGLITGLRSG